MSQIFGRPCPHPRQAQRASADLVSAAFSMDSRVAIVGQNGTGKSTLLNLITGDLQAVEGSVQRHAGLKLGQSPSFVTTVRLPV